MATQFLATVAGFRDPLQEGSMQNIRRRAEVLDVGYPASDGRFGRVVIYTMRAIQNGTTIVYWPNNDSADKTGTGPNAPGGTLTDIVTLNIF